MQASVPVSFRISFSFQVSFSFQATCRAFLQFYACLLFRLNRPSRCPRYVLPHASTVHRLRRTIHPADASPAICRSRRLALQHQSRTGAGKGAGARAAGSTVATPHPAAATLPNAPGLGRRFPLATRKRIARFRFEDERQLLPVIRCRPFSGLQMGVVHADRRSRRRQATGITPACRGCSAPATTASPNDPAAWGYAARSPTTGRTTTPSAHEIRPPQAPVSAHGSRGKFASERVEPFFIPLRQIFAWDIASLGE